MAAQFPVEKIETPFDPVEVSVHRLKTTIDRLELPLDRLETSVDGVEPSIDAIETRVEIRDGTAEVVKHALVLLHSGLDHHGPSWTRLRDSAGGGWTFILGRFVERARRVDAVG